MNLVEAIAAADEQVDAPVAATAAAAARDTGREAAQGHRYVLLSIASAHYAVREAFVTELERVPKITPVPHVPAWVRGVTNLRGDILSVIDMRTFLGLDAVLVALGADAGGPPAGRGLRDGPAGRRRRSHRVGAARSRSRRPNPRSRDRWPRT